MKVTVDVDCTPEEARRFMGLPDLKPVHEAYVANLLDAMKSGGVSPDMLDAVVKSWAPMGEAGMKMWRGMFDQVTGLTKE
ncbi:MAG: hypothetical protein H0X36_02840 [Sphingomonadaceae bacterium]|nr:hypothetical protein [Sphingomonadaceae bacterium]